MRKLVILLVVAVAAVASVTTGILMAQSPGDDNWMVGLPQQNADGTWEPEFFPAFTGSGHPAGVTRTADTFGGADIYPLPVYDEDDTSVQIGWLGTKGFWGLDEQSPWCSDCVSVTEEIEDGVVILRVTDEYHEDRTITRTTEETDEDGNVTTTIETITEGTEGPPGSTGSVND